MRVALQGSLGVYGVETFVNRLSFHLNRLGFDISNLAPFGRILFRAGTSKSILQKATGGRIGWRAALDESSVIHLNYALVSLPLLAIRSFDAPPIVYTVHGLPQPELESQPLYKVGYMFEKVSLSRVARRASVIVAISDFLSNLLMKEYGIEAKVIRNGVDADIFSPVRSEKREKIRASFHVSPKMRIVLFVGRLHPYKDPMTLVRSIPQVARKHPEAYFVMIGDGPLANAVVRQAIQLGLDGRLRLIPRLPHNMLVEWFQACDVFVSTSPGEMLGFTVLEAMSSAVPVVAAVSGGPAEVLGQSGTFFTPKDHDNLANKIVTVLDDQKLAEENGTRGREIVLQDFRWDNVALKYASLYRQLAG